MSIHRIDKLTRRFLREMKVFHPFPFAMVDAGQLKYQRSHVRDQHPHHPPMDADSRALARCIALKKNKNPAAAKHKAHAETPTYIILLLILLALVILASSAHGQIVHTDIAFVNGTRTDASGVPIKCLSGCGGAATFLDSAAFTATLTPITLGGGVFNDGLSAITSGNAAAFRITAQRGLHINLRNNFGTEIGTTSNPVQVSLANTGANTNKLLATIDPITFASPQHFIADSGTITTITNSVASTIADGANVVLGAKADAKNTATDTTAISIMSVLKEISAMEQAPASRAVTNAGTFAVQATLGAGAAVIGHVIADTGSTTAVTGNVAVTNAGLTNIDVALSTRLKPADTLAGVTTVAAVTAITNALPAGANLLGKTGIDQTTPGTTNGVEALPDTIAGVALTASAKATLTTAVVVKASAGNVYGLSVTNGAASVCWLEFMNASASPVLGTAAIFSIALPASGTVNIPPGIFSMSNFSTGISVGIATLVNGSVACGTAGNVTVFYK